MSGPCEWAFTVTEDEMTDKEIEAKVREIVCAQLEVSPEQVKPAASFIDDL